MTNAYRYLSESATFLGKIYYRGQTLSGKEVMDRVSDLAAYLLCLGIKKGDIVSIALPNIPQAIIALYAVEAVGAVAAPISHRLKKASFLKQTAGSKLIFLLASAKKMAKKSPAMKIFCGWTEFGAAPLFRLFTPFLPTTFLQAVGRGKHFSHDGIGEGTGEDPAFLLRSAGTTGEPKTVVLSSNAMNALADNVYESVSRVQELDERMGMLSALPFHHSFGLGIGMHFAMRYLRCLPMPRFSAKKAITIMKKTEVNVLVGVPSMFRKLAEREDFSGDFVKNVKLVFCGGDRLDASVKESFERALAKSGSSAKIMQGYGMSEVGSVATINVLHPEDSSVGTPIPGVEIKIDEKEILLRSESMMLGYYKNGEITPSMKTVDDKEYFPTGDLGELRGEELYLLGRKKRMIKIGGNNVFPQETEEVALSYPGVTEAVAVRTTYQGKPAVKLLVVVKKKAGANFVNGLKNHVEKNLSRYSVPREIEVVKEIKKTPFGKVDYRYYEEEEE